MSWADVAKKNRLPEDQQPHPSQDLLEGHNSSDDDLSHSGGSEDKVHVVTREEFEHDRPATDDDDSQSSSHVLLTAEDAAPSPEETARKAQADVKKVENTAKDATNAAEKKGQEAEAIAEKKGQEAKEAAKDAEETVKQEGAKAYNAAEKKAQQAKETAKDVTETAKQEGAKAYNEAGKTFDKAARATKEEFEVLSEKGQVAYNKMSKAAREDWHKLSQESKKRWDEAKNSDVGKELQKPEVWGSLLTVSNLAVIGSVAYFAYANWHKPRWDRRVVTGTVVAVGTWLGLQGYLIPQTDAVKQRRT